MSNSCANCDAFLENRDIQIKLGFARQGWCRANPPALVQVLVPGPAGQPVPGFQGVFVPTASDCWCRQWRSKREKTTRVIDLEASDAATTNSNPAA